MKAVVTTATRKRLEYMSIDGMHLYQGIQIRALRDPEGNSLFEFVSKSGNPLMAFLFRGFSEKSLRWKQDQFACKFCPADQYPTSFQEVGKLVPVYDVQALPEREMWQANTTMGEDAFWCEQNMRLEIISFPGGGCTVELISPSFSNFAMFRDKQRPADDDAVTSFALKLRKMLHTDRQIRVECLCEYGRVCSYIPVRQSMFN